MHYPHLKHQIAHIVRAHWGGDQFAQLVTPAWEIFEAFIASQHVPDLKSIDEIPTSLFSPFVAHCEASKMPDLQLLMVLAVVRTLLVFGGRDHRDLAGLVAPRKRKRVKNATSGAYQFEYIPKDAGASPGRVAADSGGTTRRENGESD